MTEQRPYDDRDGLIWLDGQLIPWREANVHVLTHALHYASSVFEGQRAYGGEVFRLTDHSKRLKRSAEILGFEIPFSVEEIDQACRDVLKANDLTDAYLRPVAWRGSEQMGVSAQNAKIHLSVAAWYWGAYFGEDAIRKGLRLDISKWRRPAPYTAPVESKAAGLYMICTMARHDAQAKGYDDALMFDYRGQVAEATGANAFFIRENKIYTPTPDCFLNGITRQTVIELAKRRGIEVVERAIWPEELESFEEFFLTGSAAEVTPVSEAGPWRFTVGELSMQLRRDYLDLVNRRSSNS
ncbi:branched-chain amino acid aminotransferase [Sphingosinicella sp. BN140058]|uniref:branched-chain amino acid aminotransferase n=1 Tax=Sphingosinicella sp. BN140058 TaxID=1892855 RepID=UPI00101357E4|nr:branched-chain amino acid aminotransferase [Sphingosinicella sp. BN140058]QAY76357.1 branched-chain amino acid aminotransferase [Sphingosinicella sp. BN140058]